MRSVVDGGSGSDTCFHCNLSPGQEASHHYPSLSPSVGKAGRSGRTASMMAPGHNFAVAAMLSLERVKKIQLESTVSSVASVERSDVLR